MGCGASQPSKPKPHPLKHGLSNFETFGQPQSTRNQPVQPVGSQLVVRRSALVDEKARTLEEKLLKQEERRSRNSSSTYREFATERSEESSASGTPSQQKMSRSREVRRAGTCDPKMLSSSREGEEARRAERRADALQRQRVQFTSMPLLLRADDSGYKRVEAHPDALHRFAICGPSPVGAKREPGRVATVAGGVTVEEWKRLVEVLFESQPDRVGFLSVLSEAQRERLVYLLARRDVAEGEVVVEQGDALVPPPPLLTPRSPLASAASRPPPSSAFSSPALPAAGRSTTATLWKRGPSKCCTAKNTRRARRARRARSKRRPLPPLPPTAAAPPTILTPPAPPTHATPPAFPPSARPTSSSSTTTSSSATTTTSPSSSPSTPRPAHPNR